MAVVCNRQSSRRSVPENVLFIVILVSFAIVAMMKLSMELWLVGYPLQSIRVAGSKITKRHPYLAKTWNNTLSRFMQFLALKPLLWQQFTSC